MKVQVLKKLNELLERYVEVYPYESDGTIYSSDDDMTITDVSSVEDERCTLCRAWTPDCQAVLNQENQYDYICPECLPDASVPCFRCGCLFIQAEDRSTICPSCESEGEVAPASHGD